MNRITARFLFLSLAIGLFYVQAFPCTTFCLKNKGEILFGKNYDWMVGDGLVFVNKHGVSKVSGVEGEKTAAKWVSKYGSVTFNQYGWESPNGGMNEAGLVIELMWLDDTQWPPADERPAIDVLEWIQYNLDTAATVEDVIANSGAVRIASSVKLHYLVNDKNGNSATIEFLEGKLVAHTGDKLPVATLTNDPYAKSTEYSKRTDLKKAQSPSSLDRFVRASARTRDFEKRPLSEKEAVDYAFETLADAAQGNYTQWSIVYDQKRGRIYFRTRQRPELKSVDTKSLDYSCGSPVKILDMNLKESGDVTAHFTNYTREANRDLIERAFNGTDFLKDVPASVKDGYAVYPERFACAGSVPDVRKSKDQAVASSYLYLVFPLYYAYKQIVSS